VTRRWLLLFFSWLATAAAHRRVPATNHQPPTTDLMSFYTEVIQKDPRFHWSQECRDLALLEPVTRAAVKSIIRDAFAMGIDLIATETYRSSERQQLLFAQRATTLRTVGCHHYGLACDFCKIIGGKASWAGDWSFLGRLAEKYGMIGGIDWGLPGVKHDFVDPDHIQRCTIAQEDGLFAGTFYPSDPSDSVNV
jgi:hypothetical protein